MTPAFCRSSLPAVPHILNTPNFVSSTGALSVAENASVFLTLLALQAGTVSVVTPLAGTAPIFALLLSHAFLRGVERVTGRIVLGTACVVLGVYLLTAL